MPGGHFDYKEFYIKEILDQLIEEYVKQGSLKNEEDLMDDELYYKNYPNEKYYDVLPPNVNTKLMEAFTLLKQSYIYITQLDRYLSGDINEESLIEQIDKEIIQDNLTKTLSAGKI